MLRGRAPARQGGVGALAVLLALTLTSLASCALPLAPAATTTSAAVTPAPGVFRPTFERGVAFPRWGPHVYGLTDTAWAPDVQQMQIETGAQWVEMTVNLYQQDYTTTSVFSAASGTTAPDDFYIGILTAREAGLHVFVEPILSVVGEPADPWGGRVHFSDASQAQQWFESYWAAYKPYVVAAASAGANQISIGTELDGLEGAFPNDWRWLLAQVRSIFKGPTSYAINHDSFAKPLPSWMTDARLTYVGASMYVSLTSAPQRLTEAQIEAQWKLQALPLLDSLSEQAGKPVLISEVGYRDTADAVFDPWSGQSSAPKDPQEQAAAYEAAVRSAIDDQHIAGVFFWAWDNGTFAPTLPAARALHSLYLAKQPLTTRLD